jgi:CRP-like cAMP-binding protein
MNGNVEVPREKGNSTMSRIEKVLGPGDILFRDGDPSDYVYLIKEGEIEISKGEGTKKKVLAVLKEGDFLGEMGVIDGSPRSATASAITETVLITLNTDEFKKEIEEDPMIGALVFTLIKRLRKTSEKLAEFS